MTLAEVLTRLPISTRQLATRAGVSHGLLNLIRAGQRAATPETTSAVIRALGELSGEIDQLRRRLRSVGKAK